MAEIIRPGQKKKKKNQTWERTVLKDSIQLVFIFQCLKSALQNVTTPSITKNVIKAVPSTSPDLA